MLLPLAILASLTFQGNFTQGGLVKITAPVGTQMALNGEKVEGYSNKYFIAFGRDAKPEASLTATYPDGTAETYPLKIEQRKWDIQHIEKVDKEIVTPNPENQKRVEKEALEIGTARVSADYTCPENLDFSRPAPGLVTGFFGSQRIYNGIPKAPHSGVDFKGNTGDPVYAPEAGRVIFIENMFVTGNTMVVDHGCGIISTFLHLSKVEKNVGDMVQKGEVIARIGATGLATGPHLHWSMHLVTTRIDPLLVVK